MAKVLTADFEKCTGCRLCELVCSVKHEGVSNPSRSRLKVEKWEWEGLYIPMLCQQCEDAPCKSVCPVKAISRDEELGRLTGADIGLAVTGIAGPTGGSEEKPVGTVYIGIATTDGTWATHFLFQGDRQQIREMTAQTGLDLVRKYLLQTTGT